MIKPYYERDGIVLYHGDARDILPDLDKESVDLSLTDPPFFMPAVHYQSRTRWQRTWGDTSILSSFWRTIVALTVPLLRKTGHFLVFCNAESYPVFYPEMYGHFDCLCDLVWDKGRVGMGHGWRHQHELLIAARWQDSTFADGHAAQPDVIRCPVTSHGDREHPVEKPRELLGQLIAVVTKEDETVLDQFAGSGSTLEAAKTLGRRAIGIEIEERYCEVAARRLGQEAQEILSLEAPGAST
jgi:site-specific DNA-methyltransferase (adenine-specific)